MTKPKGRSERAPPAPGPRQSARVKGRTPAPPDPQAWETVTTVAEKATQIIKVMDWYVQDIRDGRHMKHEWISIHANFIIDYRDRITEQSIQKKLIDTMIANKFPYILRGTWNTVKFWADKGGRLTYQTATKQDTTPTPPKTSTLPRNNPTSAANPSELPEMSAFEKLLAENAELIALTNKSPEASTTNSTRTTTPPTLHDKTQLHDQYESTGVEEYKEEPFDPVKEAYRNFTQKNEEMTTNLPNTHHVQSTLEEPTHVNKYLGEQPEDKMDNDNDNNTNSSISTSGADTTHTPRPTGRTMTHANHEHLNQREDINLTSPTYTPAPQNPKRRQKTNDIKTQLAELIQTVKSQQTKINNLEILITNKMNEEKDNPRIKTTIDQAQKNFMSWIQISKQQTLDATNEQLKDLRDDCFAEIEEEFEVQAANLRSEMDCVRTHVKHVTREELDIYKTKI